MIVIINPLLSTSDDAFWWRRCDCGAMAARCTPNAEVAGSTPACRLLLSKSMQQAKESTFILQVKLSCFV